LTEVGSRRTSSKFIGHFLAPLISCMVSRWVSCLNPLLGTRRGPLGVFHSTYWNLTVTAHSEAFHTRNRFLLAVAGTYPDIDAYMSHSAFSQPSVISPQLRKYCIFLYDCFSSLKSIVFLVHFGHAQFSSLSSFIFFFFLPPTSRMLWQLDMYWSRRASFLQPFWFHTEAPDRFYFGFSGPDFG